MTNRNYSRLEPARISAGSHFRCLSKAFSFGFMLPVVLVLYACNGHSGKSVNKDTAEMFNERRESNADQPGMVVADPDLTAFLTTATGHIYEQLLMVAWASKQPGANGLEQVFQQVKNDQQEFERMVNAVAASYQVALPAPDSTGYIEKLHSNKSKDSRRYFLRNAEQSISDAISFYQGESRRLKDEQAKRVCDSALPRLQNSLHAVVSTD